MSSNVLSSRYLNAYINCFVKQERVHALEDLKVFVTEVISSEIYFKMLVNPTINYKVKAEKLANFPFLKVRPFLKNFILLLNEKKRMGLLESISNNVDTFILNESDKVSVKVYSAVELASSQLDDIEKFIKHKLNKIPEIEVFLDESILGGIRIVTGNTVFDGTIMNTLNKLKLSFN